MYCGMFSLLSRLQSMRFGKSSLGLRFMENPYSKEARHKFLGKFALYTLLAIPGTLIGLALTISIVLAVIGIPVLILSIRPLALLNKRRVAAIVAWDFQQSRKSGQRRRNMIYEPEIEPKRPWKE